MRSHLPIPFALPVFLVWVLSSASALGQQPFSDFPVSGQISAFQIGGGYSTSNSFTLSSSATIGEAVFGAWVSRGDSVTGVTWAVGTSPYDTSLGTGTATATSSYDATNVDGYDVNTVSFAMPGITLAAGTYYLTLSSAVSASGNAVFWDINDATGVDAWSSAYGHVSAANTCFATVGISGSCASSFQLLTASSAITASPAQLTFPAENLSTPSAAQSVTLTNTASSAAVISSISLNGANPGDFAQTNNCPLDPSTLAAGGTCTINVTFTPQAAGARAAAVNLTGNTNLSIGLNGTGTSPASTVNLMPDSIAFPNQPVNTTSGTQGITVTNSGPSPLTVTSVAISGANPGDFAQTNNCPLSPASIAVNGTCTISVTFTPAAAASFSAAVSITDNGSASPQTATLTGTGTASAASLTSSLAFPNTPTGTTSGAMAATLSNTGNGALNNIAPTITGANPSDFAISTGANACGATLAAGSSCSIYVTFTPAAAASYSATLSVADSDASSPQTAPLNGTGIAPAASLTSSLAFPNTPATTTSSAMSATLSNTGNGALNNIVPSITGANPSDFAISTGANACGATLAAGSSCSIYVTFTPAAAASYSATLSVADSASGSPQLSALSGTGTAPAASLTSPLAFPNTPAGTTSSAMSATLSNTGNGALNNIVPSIGGANPGDFAISTGANACGATLAAGASCSIYVTFTPAAGASYSATLSVADSASGSPQTAALSGTGTASGPTAWPNGYNYQATFTVAAGKVPSAQTNFAALISGTYSDFATTANGGRVNNTCNQTVGNNVTAVPCDLIFTSDAAGTQLLSWEYETYTPTNGAVNIWVNVPSLASGTTIYAWYGQPSVNTLQTTPSATWTNYQAVYHMKENPAGAAPQLNDSTGNGNNATMNSAVQASQQQPGEIDGSIDFASNTFASLGSASAFSFERTDSFSISGWFKFTANVAASIISKLPQPLNSGWELEQFSGASSPQLSLAMWGTNASTGAYVETPQVSMNVWHYVVATYSGTGTTAGMTIYVDGVSQALTNEKNNLATSILNNDAPNINSRIAAGGNHESSDAMDELRVSVKGVVLSPAWVTSSYNNQSSPATFFTVATGITNP